MLNELVCKVFGDSNHSEKKLTDYHIVFKDLLNLM